MSFIFAYITAPSEVEAQKIAATLVEARLAACANIIPGMTSVYRWQGNIEQRQECVVILKTREKLFRAVEEKVKSLHSDTNPCIVALPVTAASNGFLRWVDAETGG